MIKIITATKQPWKSLHSWQDPKTKHSINTQKINKDYVLQWRKKTGKHINLRHCTETCILKTESITNTITCLLVTRKCTNLQK